MTMTERRKMLQGEPYDPGDPELVDGRRRAKTLCHQLNATDYGDRSARREALAELLPNCAAPVWVEPPFFCDYGVNITAGERLYMNHNCVILDVCRVSIGANVMLGPSVQIYTAMHAMDAVERREGIEFGRPVKIGDDCWIGGGAVICPGVSIGDRCVIGAGTVVTKDIPDDSFAAGNPARVVRTLERREGSASP